MPPGLIQWATPTAGGLLALFVVLIGLGWLVPVRTVKRELDEKDARIDILLDTNRILQERGDVLAEQLRELIPYARNADALMRELHRRVDGEGSP